jgi:hypothetical protein
VPRMLRSPAFTFARHYVEMVVAMLLGMFVLGGIGAVLLGLVGIDTGDWHTDAPALMLLEMAFTMSVSMVAWMRYRGHGWAASWEMTASMFLPTFAAIALLGLGVVEDGGALMAIQHVVMFPAMLGVMLLRRDEYTGHHHRAAVA